MKVCVYAICKNEEQFVDRWYESVKEADEIYVLDTGSTDNTINKLNKHNINVKQKIINPWRFDTARNISLNMLPNNTDICICIDLDEIIEKGWRKILEQIWKKDTNRCRYIYNWSLDEQNNPKVSFYSEKIHSRHNYKWINPVHEILNYSGIENVITTDEIIINHYPDSTKSRSSYLPLLELSIKENPDNDRNMHYLGREYMYYAKYNEAIDTLIKHINLPNAVWKDERCASMRFIARCYKYLKRYKESEMWYKLAIKEAPYLREPYIELSILYYELELWNKVIYYVNKALKITDHERTYINEVYSWNETPYDLLSIAYFNEKKYKASLRSISKALEYSNDERLISNKIIIEQML